MFITRFYVVWYCTRDLSPVRAPPRVQRTTSWRGCECDGIAILLKVVGVKCSRFSVTVEVVGSIFIFLIVRFVFSFAGMTEKYVCASQIRFEGKFAQKFCPPNESFSSLHATCKRSLTGRVTNNAFIDNNARRARGGAPLVNI